MTFPHTKLCLILLVLCVPHKPFPYSLYYSAFSSIDIHLSISEQVNLTEHMKTHKLSYGENTLGNHLISKGKANTVFKNVFSKDSDTGRQGSPPHTTASQLQLKYRTPSLRNVRNWAEWKSDNYEIELNGSLTTMELKKPHLSRLVGGAQTWNGLALHPHR